MFCLLFFFFRAALAAHGGSQARGLIGAAAAGLRHSHSNVESKPSLQPTPQFMATPDPQPTEQGQGSNHILVVTNQIRLQSTTTGTLKGSLFNVRIFEGFLPSPCPTSTMAVTSAVDSEKIQAHLDSRTLSE